ncbi:hypothetical protein DL93DRAFT_2166960 [Clavulina sp. PMI_390]|nr:hypothetical protein DL93DRAFT_2166960 [Clavulina sp. PMI_390]
MSTSPAIDSLPNEIILQIFREAVLAGAYNTTPASMSIKDLISISAVSSLWRVLAINDATLWTEIYVGTFDGPNSPSRSETGQAPLLASDFERANAFTGRSQTLPIRLELAVFFGETEYSSQEAEDKAIESWRGMLNVLGPHLERCRFLQVIWALTSSLMMDEITDWMQRPQFPLLTGLSMLGSGPDTSPVQEHLTQKPWNIQTDNSLLESLRFGHSKFYLPSDLDVSWLSLSTLELQVSEGFWANVQDTLALLPSLKELQLTLFELDSGPSAAPLSPRVVLPKLQDITTNYPLFWTAVSCPNLSSITVEYTPSTHWTSVHKSPQVSKSIAKLTTVRNLTISAGSLLCVGPQLLLCHLTHVETLKLDSCGDIDLVLPLLTPETPEDEITFPRFLAGLVHGPVPENGVLPRLRNVQLSGELRAPIVEDFAELIPKRLLHRRSIKMELLGATIIGPKGR